MAASKNNDMYSYLDQLSTQELESLLQKDAEAPDGGDLDMVMYIMEVIEKREGGSDKEKPLPLWKIFLYVCNAGGRGTSVVSQWRGRKHTCTIRA